MYKRRCQDERMKLNKSGSKFSVVSVQAHTLYLIIQFNYWSTSQYQQIIWKQSINSKNPLTNFVTDAIFLKIPICREMF